MFTTTTRDNVEIGEIVIKGRNHFSTPKLLKYRVSSFIKIDKYILINGYRVKFDKRLNDWVSFGKEHTLLDAFHFTQDDFHYMR